MSITISQIHSLRLDAVNNFYWVQSFKLSDYEKELSVSDIKKKTSLIPNSLKRFLIKKKFNSGRLWYFRSVDLSQQSLAVAFWILSL